MSRFVRARAASALAIAAWLTSSLTSSFARADGEEGRLEGDLDLSAGAGVAVTDPDVTEKAPALVARTAATFASIAGLYAGYADTFGAPSARFARQVTAGVTVKPIFWARFSKALTTGSPRADLLIDSLILEAGAVWSAPVGGAMESQPGMELAVGFGFPILPNASGPFVELRGALRYRPIDLDGRTPSEILDRGVLVSLSLSWHQIVNAHIVDAGDRAMR
ncbi:MAG: hypothetical protein U0441_18450 [Polyangiaceae bacterium]